LSTTPNEKILELDALSKSFKGPRGRVDAVQDVSFEVARGDYAVIFGPSGCGKTTLLLMAGGLLLPDSGSVLIQGENPYRLPPRRRSPFRASHIGFVFQDFHLIPYLSVMDNVLAPTLSAPDADLRGRARELLDRFGLDHRAEHLPAELSVGEQQRTALARALIREPGLILADEPTGNLDRENADRVLDHLRSIAGEHRAVVMVTHDEKALSEAGKHLHIDRGKGVPSS
jgi:ABC-type lipoprotein export system ATPase subunit